MALDPVGVVGDPGTDFLSEVGDDPLGVSPPDFLSDPCRLNPPVPICDVRGKGAGVSTFSLELEMMAPLSLKSRLMAASASAAEDLSAREDVEECLEDLEQKLFEVKIKRFSSLFCLSFDLQLKNAIQFVCHPNLVNNISCNMLVLKEIT